MKFFFGLLAFIAAAVVVVLLVISLFRSFGDTPADRTVNTTYSFDDPSADNAVIRYKITGPIVAEEDYREIHITISKSVRTIEIIKGYKGTVEKSESLSNNLEAHRAFMGALEAARFSATRGEALENPVTTCVTGTKYYYELSDGSKKPVDTWSSSCSNSQGNFAGNARATRELFRAQIPRYSELTSGINIAAR